MAEVINVEVRESRGKRNARRMRRSGAIPCVLYGHGEEVLSLAVPEDQIAAALRHGSRLVELRGAVNQRAFIRELQWDVYGTEVLHIDFARVALDEKVEVTVPIELRGEAPGIKEGGVVEVLLHEVELECPAVSIPEKLELNVNELQLNESLTVADLELPAGATVLGEADAVIAQCHLPAEAPEEEEVPGEGAEPEIIGRAAGEEEEEG